MRLFQQVVFAFNEFPGHFVVEKAEQKLWPALTDKMKLTVRL